MLRLIARVRARLPQGSTLPSESWRARHGVILVVAFAHAIAVPVYGIASGYPVTHTLVEGSAIGTLAAVAWLAGRQDLTRLASSAASVSLLTASALVVHLSSGVTEAHFHFFVMIVVLTLYEDWVPFLVSLGYVILHHGILGLLEPEQVFGHAQAVAHPARFALIHAAFVAAAGIAGVSTWRHNEQARAQALGAQVRADRLYRSLVESLEEGVLLQGPDGTIRTANGAVATMVGLPVSEVVGRRDLDMPGTRLVREDGSHWPYGDHPPQVTGRTGEAQRNRVMGIARTGQETTWFSLTTRPLEKEDEGWSVVTSIIDITERRRAEIELQRLADRDPLTGLLNRRRLEVELGRCLAAAARHEDAGAVIVLDLDNFKYVNDSLGHTVGDELICAAAAAIGGCLRPQDAAARLGGDEFAVVLPGADEGLAREMASAVLTAVREATVETIDGPRRTTASAGIAIMGPGRTADEVLTQADMAMYEVKDLGKDGIAVFDPLVDRQAQAKAGLAWAERIRSALADGGLFLEAQPLVSLPRSDSATRYELLVRMRDDDGGTVSPSIFLPVAERFELMSDIDRWVLRQATQLLGALRRDGRHDVELSVNLSPRSMHGEMLDVLRRSLAEHGGDPSRLTVEITETAAIADLGRAQAFASDLAELGVRLALDDFGAGFASFQYLTQLDFDEIKIDGEYVKDLAQNKTHQVLVRSLADLAHGLSKEVTAEFVQDDQTIRLLRTYGIRWGQGFHLGRPQPLEQVGLVREPQVGEVAAPARDLVRAGTS